MDKYCVYLTEYHGDKLPPLYIGSTSIAKVQRGYHGTVQSREFKSIWISELSENPHLFVTSILSTHAKRQDAFEAEALLQIELQASKSELFINRAIASRNFFFGSRHTVESCSKISAALSGVPKTEEHAQRISTSLQDKPKSASHCQSLVEAWNYRDHTMTDAQKIKISNSLTGKNRTCEARKNISAGKKGIKQQQVLCPHCQKTGGISAMKTYHFDNCKNLCSC